jgi:Uma2 family endonuclease
MPVGARHDTRLTYEDFCRIPDDGKRHEIIDGVHYVTPAPSMRHQRILGRLHLELGVFLKEHPEFGEVFFAPFDVLFSNWDIVEPDLLLVAADQQEILTEKNVQGAPALVVEILSPSTRKRDLQLKRQLFERSGVREYWVIDGDRRGVLVYRRAADGSFPSFELAATSDTLALATPLLPGFSIVLSELFR